jgi:large subunit ribosomal protein L4
MSFKISILNNDLQNTSTVDAFATLVDFKVKDKLLAEVIRAELSNLRTSNAHTKNRGEVRGGGRKPWKQKGTGRARHGSRRSPIWVGGGITMGPRNTTNWHLKINKGAKISALKSIIKDRLDHSTIVSLDGGFDFQKTNDFTKSLTQLATTSNLKTKDFTFLYSTGDKEKLNGIPNSDAKLLNVENIKIHKLAIAKTLVLTPKALEILQTRFI